MDTTYILQTFQDVKNVFVILLSVMKILDGIIPWCRLGQLMVLQRPCV